MENLIEIRCPLKKTSNKYGRPYTYDCNKLIVRVAKGSAGEAFCWGCDKGFEFDVAK